MEHADSLSNVIAVMCEGAILEAMLRFHDIGVEARTDVASGYLIDGGAIRIEAWPEANSSRTACRIDAAGRCFRLPYRARFVEKRGCVDIRFALDDLVLAYKVSVPYSEEERADLDAFIDDALPAIFLAAVVQEAYEPQTRGGEIAAVGVDVDGIHPSCLWCDET